MGLMELFSNPETMHSLSLGDKLVGGCITMLMGMGITFLVLLLLWGFVAVMGRALKEKKKEDKGSANAIVTPSVATAPTATVPASDDSLIAVITAAVAAYQGAGGTGNLIIRKISRISGEITPWSNAAREDCIESRKF